MNQLLHSALNDTHGQGGSRCQVEKWLFPWCLPGSRDQLHQGLRGVHLPCDLDAWSALGSWSLAFDILPFTCCVPNFLNSQQESKGSLFLPHFRCGDGPVTHSLDPNPEGQAGHGRHAPSVPPGRGTFLRALLAALAERLAGGSPLGDEPGGLAVTLRWSWSEPRRS